MTVSVSPTTASTHHISLQDVDGYTLGLIVAAASPGGYVDRDIKLLARSPIDRTAMKTSSGDTEYSDWRPPYYALKQDDWSGGRGSDDYTKDRTKFYDAGGLNTRRPGFLHLNGQEQFSGLLRTGGQIQPGSMDRPVVPTPTSTEWATKCTLTQDEILLGDIKDWDTQTYALGTIVMSKFTADKGGIVTSLKFTCVASVGGNVVLGLYADSAGSPAALLGQTASAAVASGAKRVVEVALAASIRIEAGTVYWIAFNSSAAFVRYYGASSSGTTKYQAAAYAALPDPAGAGYSDATYSSLVLAVGYADVDQVWFFSHLDTAITGIKLYNGAGTSFQTVITTNPATLTSSPPSYAPGWHVVNLTTPIAVDPTNGVWISIPLTATDKIARDQAITGYLKQGASTIADKGFPVRVLRKETPRWGRFFKYAGRMFYLEIGTVVHLYVNGYRGMLTTGGTLTLTDTRWSGVWATNELAGAIFEIEGGTAFGQYQRWRKIASNTSAGAITLSEAFDLATSTDTVYHITGLNNWDEVTAHGLSAYVSDILVSDKGVVYFAAGVGFALKKMYFGLLTADANWLYWADDAAAPGPAYMCEVGTTIWGIANTTQARSAPQPTTFTLAYSTPLVWSAEIPIGDIFSPTRGVQAYVDGGGYKAAMVFREGEFGFISQGVYNKVQLDELKAMAGERNGRTNLVHDTNAYFSFGPGLERWYYPNLDDVGANRDDGLPAGRQGDVRAMAGYPGRFFEGNDAGATGYSSVFSSGGWHEEWRGAYGQRIMAIMPQTIPSTDTLDRLWIAAGGSITYMPLPSEIGNPLNDSNMLYQAGGYITLSTMMTEMKNVLKYISLIRLFFKDTPVASCLEVQYKINGGAWTDLDSLTNPVTTDQTVVRYNLTNVVSDTGYYGIKAYSIQIRIKLFTTSKTTTPVMLAFVMELLARIDNKYAYTIPFMLEGTAIDPARDLNSVNDDIPAADTKLDKLIAWASAGPLYMRSQDTRFHNKMVLLLPFTESLTEYNSTSGQKQYLGQLTLQDA